MKATFKAFTSSIPLSLDQVFYATFLEHTFIEWHVNHNYAFWLPNQISF